MKLLFVHKGLNGFVAKDFMILQQTYEVRPCYFRWLWDIPRLLQGVIWCDVTLSWFSALHAFFAVPFSRLLGKKSIVTSGGYEVANVPEIGYGFFASRWKKYCPLFVFRYVDLILCFSKVNREETLTNGRADPRKVRIIYQGFDAEMLKIVPEVEKEDIVLTIGLVAEDNLSRKGLELFVRSASFLPDRRFFLVGRWGDRAINRLKEFAPPNVTFTGELSQEELVRMCSRAKVYVQASKHEAFGCAVAEAMLCECVPVVSRCGALPEVVGDCGFYVDNLEPQEVAAMIEEALHSDIGKRARERIKNYFPLEKRRKELQEAINGLVED